MKTFFILRAKMAQRMLFTLIFAVGLIFFGSCKSMYMCPTYFKADAQKYKGESKTSEIYHSYNQKKPKNK